MGVLNLNDGTSKLKSNTLRHQKEALFRHIYVLAGETPLDSDLFLVQGIHGGAEEVFKINLPSLSNLYICY